MNENTREGMGFLCRWTLLTLTVATMVAVALSCLMGAAATTETDWDVVIPDGLCRENPTDRTSLKGYCSRELDNMFPPLGITVWDTSDYKFTDRGFNFSASRSEIGQKVVEIRGVPYGPFAFQRRTGNLYIIPVYREVFLIDLRLAVEARQEGNADFEECLARLSRQGSVALALCEKIGNYRSAVRSAAELRFDVPVLCADNPKLFEPLRTLWRARNMLKRSKNDDSCPVFITGNMELAVLAARDRIPTRFVGKYSPTPDDIEKLRVPPGMMRRFESFAEFKESLATGQAGD